MGDSVWKKKIRKDVTTLHHNIETKLFHIFNILCMQAQNNCETDPNQEIPNFTTASIVTNNNVVFLANLKRDIIDKDTKEGNNRCKNEPMKKLIIKVLYFSKFWQNKNNCTTSTNCCKIKFCNCPKELQLPLIISVPNPRGNKDILNRPLWFLVPVKVWTWIRVLSQLVFLKTGIVLFNFIRHAKFKEKTSIWF